MYAQIEKLKENKIRAVANSVLPKRGLGLVGNRPHNITQRKRQDMGGGVIGMAQPISNAIVQKPSSSGYLVAQRHIFSFLGLGKKKDPELVPKSDTSAFTNKEGEKIVKAITAAYQMVVKAEGKINKTNSGYKKFMDSGETNPAGTDARVQHVQDGFKKINTNLKNDEHTFKKYALKDGEEKGTYAYVTGSDTGSIYLGGAYWKAKGKGYDSKAGTIIHELSHELHATKDHTYGVSDSKESAKNTPEKSTTNADNYEHFAEKA